MKSYRKDQPESAALGVFVTMELLRHRPEVIKRILVSAKADRNQGAQEILAFAREKGIPAETADKALARLAGKENCYLAGVFEKYTCELDPNKSHVVLVNPGNMGNLGTILRTMLGFGVMDLAIISPGADIFDPRVIRASMGALFSLRFAYFASFADYQKQAGPRAFYPFMLKGAKRLDEVEIQAPYSLIFGNEATGLSDDYLDLGQSVFIEHGPRIDSLNLALAAGIGLYVFTRPDFIESRRKIG